MEEDLLDGADSEDEAPQPELNELMFSNIPSTASSSISDIVDSPLPVPKKGKLRTLVPWTDKQKEVVRKFFKNHIKGSKPPRQIECEELKCKYPELLQNKDLLKIKVYIQNEYKKKHKRDD